MRPAITLEGISIAATTMGAAAFLDLPILRGEPVLRHVRRR